MICQLYDSWYRENCINMLSNQNTAMNWILSLKTACIIVPECTIKVLKYWKLYKDAYILQESFAMTDKSYPSPCRNYLKPLYLSVTLYACAQRDSTYRKTSVYYENLPVVAVLKYFNFRNSSVQRNKILLKRSIQTENGDKQIFCEQIISKVTKGGCYLAQTIGTTEQCTCNSL